MSEDEKETRMEPGLVISMNESIKSFLLSASEDPALPHDIRDLISSISSEKSISYKLLRNVWSNSSPSERPPLRRLFSDVEFVLQRPKPREKCEELRARLKKLGELGEEREYRELVKDIVPRNEPSEPFSSYKDQLGFGLHVVLMMFTGYLFGFMAFRALFNHSAVMNAAGGILGLVCGMLVETTLFIIRSSPVSSSSSTSHHVSMMKKLE